MDLDPGTSRFYGYTVEQAQAMPDSHYDGDERARLWRKANEVWPHYDEYAKKTQREIPVVVLERIGS